MLQYLDKVTIGGRTGWVVKVPSLFEELVWTCRAGDGSVFHVTELMLGGAVPAPERSE